MDMHSEGSHTIPTDIFFPRSLSCSLLFFLVFVDRSDYSDIWRDIRGVHYV